MSETRKKGTQSFFDAIWSSVLWTGLDRATSLFKHVFIASVLGLSAELDVFYMAVGLLSLFVFSWSRIADVIAVPKLVDLVKSGDTVKFRQYTGDLFVLAVSFSVVLGLVLTSAWPWITGLAWGFDESRKVLLNETIFWAQPILYLYVPMHMLYSFSRSQRMFYVIYRNEFMISVVILACIVKFPSAPGVLMWSYSLGITIAFLFTLIHLSRRINFWGCPWSGHIKLLLPIIPTLLLLYAAQYLYLIIDRQFVSFLPKGAVSAIAYGWTVTGLLPTLLRLEGAFITVYAESKSDDATRTDTVNNLVSATLTIGTVVTFFMYGFSEDVIGLLLERGNFTHENTLLVAGCTSFFAFSTIPILLIGPLGQIFQIEKRLMYIVTRVLFGVLLNLVLCYLFMFTLNWETKGIALATSLSQWGMLSASLLGVERLGLALDYRRHTRWLIIMTGISCLALLTTAWINTYSSSYWMILPKSLMFGVVVFTAILLQRGQDSQLVKSLALRSIKKFGFSTP